MSIKSFQTGALKQREREMPDSITWNSNPLPIIPGSKTKGGTLEIGGVEISFDFSCTIRRELFTTLPKKGQTIVHGTDTLRIVNVIEAPGGSHIRLLLESPTRGI